MSYVYIVKSNESAAFIAAKFGRTEQELVYANPQISRKVVYYIGQPYMVFKDLYINQRLNIPFSWLNWIRDHHSGHVLGIGADPYAISVNIAGPGQACNFDMNGNPDDITQGSNVCAMGLRCNNGVCGGTNGDETMLCIDDNSCPSNYHCAEDTKTCISGAPTTPTKTNTNDLPPNTEISGSCTDDSVIRFVQSAIGAESDGKWGCGSQKALEAKGLAYKDIVNCDGELPDPCDYGQCVNGKCPVSSGPGPGITPVKDTNTGAGPGQETTFPWGWVLVGTVLVAAGGGIGYYYYSKNKQDKASGSDMLAMAEPARKRGLNNEDRSQWIDNDEGLYSWWKSSRLSKREFIKQNKAEIDAAITNVTSGTKQAHYLKYDPIRKFGHLNEPLCEPSAKTWTVYIRNEVLGTSHFTGTFKSEQEAIDYSEREANRSRKFVTFEVFTGTPKNPIQAIGPYVRGKV